jgi:hypothetical protein
MSSTMGLLVELRLQGLIESVWVSFGSSKRDQSSTNISTAQPAGMDWAGIDLRSEAHHQ